MPGLNGVQVAQGVTGTRVVFVTAYDAFALQAFDAAAADYLLAAGRGASAQVHRAAATDPWRAAAGSARARDAAAALDHRRPRRQQQRLIAAGEVVYFKARDKYTEVVTVEESHLIRMSLRELAARLDPDGFAQIHRGLIVNLARAVDRAGPARPLQPAA